MGTLGLGGPRYAENLKTHQPRGRSPLEILEISMQPAKQGLLLPISIVYRVSSRRREASSWHEIPIQVKSPHVCPSWKGMHLAVFLGVICEVVSWVLMAR